LIHVSMGNDAIDEVANLPGRKGRRVSQHHARALLQRLQPERREVLRDRDAGQLKDLATKAELGIADSEFNRASSRSSATRRPRSCRSSSTGPRSTSSPTRGDAHAAEERTSIVTVGQLLPHKGIHDVIAAFARYRERDRGARPVSRGIHGHVAGVHRAPARRRRPARLKDAVTFAGSVPIESLVAYYRGATALLTLSEHEGFCVPLLEAMRSDLRSSRTPPVRSPTRSATRACCCRTRRRRPSPRRSSALSATASCAATSSRKGRARLAEFTPERVAERLRDALALAGWDLPERRTRKVVVLSSDQRCGIHHYALSLTDGLRAAGHDVTFVGVKHLDKRDLAAKVRHITNDTEAVIVEHEHGIFSDVPFVRALISFWRRKIPVVLSMHEIEPEKFHHFRLISSALHYRPATGRSSSSCARGG
jgi:hypothetical protein